MNGTEYFYAVISGLFGFCVGLSELANRYKSFTRIFYDLNSWLYMMINFIAGFFVYVIIKQYNFQIGPLKDHHIGLVLFCGLGAMAFLRSSFFTYKDSSGKTFDIGPAALLAIFTRVAETQFDQLLSKQSIDDVEPIMRKLSFVSASKDLPLLVLASMRVLSADEQKVLSDEVSRLVNDNSITSDVKNIALGLILLRYSGKDLLQSASTKLKAIYDSTTQVSLNQLTPIIIPPTIAIGQVGVV
jgi:hypothetical protein